MVDGKHFGQMNATICEEISELKKMYYGVVTTVTTDLTIDARMQLISIFDEKCGKILDASYAMRDSGYDVAAAFNAISKFCEDQNSKCEDEEEDEEDE